jgi:hypothetical protein
VRGSVPGRCCAAALVHHRLALELRVIEHAGEALVDFHARFGLASAKQPADASEGFRLRCAAVRATTTCARVP